MPSKAPQGLIKSNKSFLFPIFRKIKILFLPEFRPLCVQAGLGIIIFFVFLVLLQRNNFSRFENYFFDSYFKFRPPISTASEIVIIEIAKDSTQLMGKFPWPRQYHAALVEILRQWNAKMIFFDITFSYSGSKPEDDEQLAQAFKRHGNIYLPVYQDSLDPPSAWHHSNLNIEQFSKGLGHINIQPESDGIVRRVSSGLIDKDLIFYPHIALQMAADYLGKKKDSVSLIPKKAVMKDGTFYIDWAGKWANTFTHYSYADIFRSYTAIQKGQKPVVEPENLKGKIVLVAFTSTGGADVKTNPIETAYPGVGVIANTLNMVFRDRWIRTMSPWTNSLFLFGLVVVAFASCIPFRPIQSTIVIFLCLVFWTGFCFFLLFSKQTYLYLSYGLFYLILFYAVSAVWAKLIADRERVELMELATRDGLTGVYLRRYFLIVLEKTIKKEAQFHRPLCLIMLDVDHFKKINDAHGHEAGDMVLKNIAQVLQVQTRLRRVESQADCIARYGGEEFVVMTLNANIKDAAFNVAERIRKAVESTPFKSGSNQSISATISLGVAQFRNGEEPLECLRRADKALYEAKHQGRNRVCIAD